MLKSRGALLSLALIALLLLLGAQPALAASIEITNDCPLKAAITAANNDSNSHDTDCTAGSGADVITFASGVADTHYVNPGATLDIITSEITIEGAGKEIQGTATGNEMARILEVGNGGKLTVKGLKIGYGKTNLANDGAGMMITSGGEATLIGVEITENNSANRGGGLSVWNGGKLTMIDSRVHNNTSSSGGGGMYIESGAQVTIRGSTIYSNTGSVGAGIESGGNLTISNSTIAENTASSSSIGGGGMYVRANTATISHVTVYDNTAGSNSLAGEIEIRGSATKVNLRNSIVCDNDSSSTDLSLVSSGTLSQNVGNVIGQGSAATGTCGDLGSRVGSPEYYVPPSGSGALGNGDAAICRAYPTDQAGRGRPASGCDSGSVERGGLNYIHVDATCSLNEAIVNANNAAQDNADCESGTSDDAASDVISLTVDVTVVDGASTTSATSKILVEGNGKTVSGASGATDARLFHVGSGGNLTLRNITLSGGRANQGAAVHSRGTLTMENCTVTGNVANGNDAGAIVIWDNSTATIKRCTFRDNSATLEGGAINVASGTMTITDSVFQENTAGNEGGALNLESGTLTVSRSSFIGNRSDDQTYTENYGGAIYALAGTLTVDSSTFSGNYGQEGGGAIYVNGDTATLAHLTLWDNTSGSAGHITGVRGGGTTHLQNSIIGRSTTVGGALCGGSFHARGAYGPGLIVWNGPDTHGCGSADTRVVNPGLGALTTSGIPYYPLQAGSPAIRAGTADQCDDFALDQDGNSRPATNCDVGAVQHIPAAQGVGGVGGGERAAGACTGKLLNQAGYYRVSASYGLCSGVEFQVVDGSGVGIAWIVEAGFIDALDVWGWVQPTVEVCFPQAGSTLFLNAAASPRAVEPLASYRDGHRTCASIGKAGTVVLLPADSAHTTQAAAAPPGALGDCMVTTNYILNLRQTPDGEVVALLPFQVTLTAYQKQGDWYYVDYHGARGWVSADYVTPVGNCG